MTTYDKCEAKLLDASNDLVFARIVAEAAREVCRNKHMVGQPVDVDLYDAVLVLDKALSDYDRHMKAPRAWKGDR